jgi:rRNA maturation protein Nop10
MKKCGSCGAEDIDEFLAKDGWCSKCGQEVNPETPAEWTPDNNFDDGDDDLAPVED